MTFDSRDSTLYHSLKIHTAADVSRLLDAERAACAEVARAQPCVCCHLVVVGAGEDFDGEIEGAQYYTKPGGEIIDGRVVTKHDSQCPQSIAAAIEARGKL